MSENETYQDRRGKKRCAYCGNVFVPQTSRSRFCSPECARKGINAEKLKERVEKRMKEAVESPRLCVICGKPIPLDPNKRYTKKTCSLGCSKALATRRVVKCRRDRREREKAQAQAQAAQAAVDEMQTAIASGVVPLDVPASNAPTAKALETSQERK